MLTVGAIAHSIDRPLNWNTKMTASDAEQSNPLLAISNNLADIVSQTEQSIVAVHGRRMGFSGVHWRSGIVVTVDHAISREETIRVMLPDQRPVAATLIGRDPSTDLAVLKIENACPVATLEASETLKVGQMVMAIGRGDSGVGASLGVIGSLGGTWRTWHGGRVDQFVRPALHLYPGASGGALVNVAGRVIGINTAAPRRMTLTIPTATVNRVVDQLMQTGRVARGYLGVGMQPVRLPELLTRSLNLPNESGVLIMSIEPGSPADQAGVLIGDIVVALAGVPVGDVDEIHAMLDADQVGNPLATQIIRGGNLSELSITVGERPVQGA
jgi:S1-C subfamily serine protease